ncbi:aa3-type cytochrome c oxidase subunit IV [Ferrovibrio sp.]|nr:aa3-type cytochrome c oxidase subunit IV [Ferrovibrio sp.]
MASEQHQMGTMDISQHKAAWAGFMKMTTWGSAALIVLLILMAIFLL